MLSPEKMNDITAKIKKAIDSVVGEDENLDIHVRVEPKKENIFSKLQEWADKAVAEKNKKELEALMDFSDALEALKDGYKVARKIWNKGEYIKAQFPDKNSKMTSPYLYGRGSNGSIAPFNVKDSDVFTNDWFIVKS